MTQQIPRTAPRGGVDADRVDGGSRGLWRRIAAALVVGIVLGGLAGLVYGLTRPESSAATTALSVLPDSSVGQSQDTGTQQDATSFIQSQLVVLNGEQLATTVQQTLGLTDRPTVTSAQVGQTYVVQVTATAADADRAAAVATAAGATYTTLRTGQLTASLDAREQQVATQVAAVQQALVAATPSAGAVNTGVTPAQSALQTQYQTLLQTQSALQLERTQVAQVVTVLTPATAVTPGVLSGPVTSTLVGALLGAIVALALFGAARRLSPRIRSVGDLTALGVPVLLPVLPTRRRRTARGPHPWRSDAGRLLAARLAGRGSARPTPVVVVGATSRVGASHVAASLAAGMAERGPLLLVLASRLGHGADPRPAGPTTAEVSVEGLAGGPLDAIRHAVPCEIPGVWVLPYGDELADTAGPSSAKRIALLTDVLRRATAAGWQVVVDAPALSVSDIAVDCAAGHGVAVLVVARGVSRPADVVSAAELFEVQGGRFAGAVLDDVPGRRSRRRSGGGTDGSADVRVDVEPPVVELPERPRGRRRVPVSSPREPARERATAERVRQS